MCECFREGFWWLGIFDQQTSSIFIHNVGGTGVTMVRKMFMIENKSTIFFLVHYQICSYAHTHTQPQIQ